MASQRRRQIDRLEKKISGGICEQCGRTPPSHGHESLVERLIPCPDDARVLVQTVCPSCGTPEPIMYIVERIVSIRPVNGEEEDDTSLDVDKFMPSEPPAFVRTSQ